MGDRIIRAGIRKSERTAKLVKVGGWFAGVFYAWLLTLVDDYGRYDARPAVLRAEIFPFLLDDVTEEMIADAIRACVSAGLARHYINDGKPFIELADFNQRMRSATSKFPGPQDDDVTLSGQCSDKGTSKVGQRLTDTDTDTDTLKPPTPLKRKRGTPPPDEPPGFARFMAAWPDHERKPSPGSAMRVKCRQLWDRAGLEAQADDVLAGLDRWKRSRQWTKNNGEYIPGPHPWLNDRKFTQHPVAGYGPAAGGNGNGADHETGFQRTYNPALADVVIARINARKQDGKPKPKN